MKYETQTKKIKVLGVLYIRENSIYKIFNFV